MYKKQKKAAQNQHNIIKIKRTYIMTILAWWAMDNITINTWTQKGACGLIVSHYCDNLKKFV